MAETIRRSLPTRIVQRIQRDMRTLAQRAYLHLFAVPVLWLKGELPFTFSVLRGHGAFVILSARGFLKVAVTSEAAPQREYANYLRLLELRPDLSDLLPNYRHVRTPGLSVLACERLHRISHTDALVPAVTIYQRFRSNTPATGQLRLADCPQIAAGLRCIEAGFSAEIVRDVQTRAEAFLAEGQYTKGLAHGDFHSRNLMCDDAGGYRLIDLDCVRLAGVAEFDALYFALEQVWSETGRLWTEVLAESFARSGSNIALVMSAFAARWSPGLGVAFVLDRIGQDFVNYGTRYAQRNLVMVIDAARNAA